MTRQPTRAQVNRLDEALRDLAPSTRRALEEMLSKAKRNSVAERVNRAAERQQILESARNGDGAVTLTGDQFGRLLAQISETTQAISAAQLADPVTPPAPNPDTPPAAAVPPVEGQPLASPFWQGWDGEETQLQSPFWSGWNPPLEQTGAQQ